MKKGFILLLLLAAGFSAHAVFSAERQEASSPSSNNATAELSTAVPAQAGPARRADASENSESGVQEEEVKLPPSDLAGLRYFVQIGDMKRLRKEIERLQSIYPGWKPPKDLSSLKKGSDPELDRMWDMFAKGEFPELRKLIAEREKDEPGWTAPEDLLTKLAAGEARSRLVNASHLKQYDTVIRIAADNPELLTCANVDIMWRLADAFAETGKNERAKDAYFYVLEHCDVPSERIATIRKAVAVLPPDIVDQLIAEERVKADGQGEFQTIRDDLARLSVSRSLKDGKPVNQKDLQDVERIANSKDNAEDALLLGWYYLEQQDFVTAENWFQKASLKDDTGEAEQGLGLALVGLGEPETAEEKLRPWWKASARNQANYLSAASAVLAERPKRKIGPDAFQAIVLAVTKAKDADAAQQIGWYAYEVGQTKTAAQWFASALSWQPDDEAAAYGLGLSLNKLKDFTKLKTLVAEWSGRSKRIAALARAEKQAGAANLNRSVRSNCSGFVQLESLSPGSALSRGWCLMNKNRALEAADAFAVALARGAGKVRDEAAYGQSLAYLRLGLVNQASVSATQARMSPKRRRELQLDILSKRASAAFEVGRYTEALLALDERRRLTPEQSDLMLMRGYAYSQMGRYEDALRVFGALSAAGFDEGTKGVYATRSLRRARARLSN